MMSLFPTSVRHALLNEYNVSPTVETTGVRNGVANETINLLSTVYRDRLIITSNARGSSRDFVGSILSPMICK